jgi:hypothetical protein
MIAGMFLIVLYQPSNVMLVFNGLSLLNSISVIFILFWTFSVGTVFYPYQPVKKHLSLRLFQIAIILIFLALIYFCMVIYRNNYIFPELPVPQLRFIILLLLVLCSLVYIVFFISKSIKSIEISKNPYIGDIILYMALLLFVYPIAVWVIQPKINQICLKYLGTPV